MKLLFRTQPPTAIENGCVAAIGNFDGVHLGHQNLLTLLKKTAIQLQLPLLVILFEPQPSEFFLNQNAPARLYTLRDKIKYLTKCGVDYIYCLRFNPKLAQMSAEDFAQTIIFDRLKIKHLLIGEDFRFGHDRHGDSELLKKIGKTATITTCKNFLYNQTRISSTKIRQALQANQFNLAQQLLGRPYAISGRVIHGQRLARQLGFPTANITIKQRIIAIRGVFCVNVQRNNMTILSGVANIGYRPTVDGKKLVLEVHLLDHNESIYGEKLSVIFLHKLRDEIKFDSIEQLKTQINLDVEQAKKYFVECIQNV
jgi:riboflavin kinase / FMN adenylyltransferase